MFPVLSSLTKTRFWPLRQGEYPPRVWRGIVCRATEHDPLKGGNKHLNSFNLNFLETLCTSGHAEQISHSLSGKSKRGLSKRGAWPKTRQLGQKAPFRGNFCSSPWQWGAEELVPIGPEKAPKRSDFPWRVPPISLKIWGSSPRLWAPLVACFARIDSHDSCESGESRESEIRVIRANRPDALYK